MQKSGIYFWYAGFLPQRNREWPAGILRARMINKNCFRTYFKKGGDKKLKKIHFFCRKLLIFSAELYIMNYGISTHIKRVLTKLKTQVEIKGGKTR